MHSHTILSIPLDDRTYSIQIGDNFLENSGVLISQYLVRKRVFILTDENVYAAQFDALKTGLEKADIDYHVIVLPPGEQTKSFQHLEDVCSKLLQFGIERNDVILAFGGGVIGDLAGFTASIIKRGCRFIQIPTTLLAQVDSSVGGKTAINSPEGKNLIGAFYQPELVIIDIATLNSLPERQIKAGYAEVVKYGLLGDADFFEWLERYRSFVIAENIPALLRAIETSVRKKSDLVAEDEKEHGARALLNLGHTFGHALEAEAGYSDALLHGESVAIGMVLAFEYSHQQNLCAAEDVERVKAHLQAVGLPTRIQDIEAIDTTPEILLNHMYKDKKVEGGKLTFILARGIGDAFIQKDVPSEQILTFLKTKMTTEV